MMLDMSNFTKYDCHVMMGSGHVMMDSGHVMYCMCEYIRRLESVCVAWVYFGCECECVSAISDRGEGQLKTAMDVIVTAKVYNIHTRTTRTSL